jgi:gliding motility-associated-like protein
MLNKTTIVFICVFVLNIFLLKSQPQTISLCETIPVNKKYWVESVLGYNSVWSINPDVEYQLQQDNTILVQWTDPGVYTIIVQYFNGDCSNKSEMQVQVEECPDIAIYIPNSFTPNDDKINDIFEAYGVGIVEFNMMIFNRWGELIFESDKIENQLDGLHMGGWNGTYKGNEIQEDVYSYVIKYKGISTPKKIIYGKILLIR